MVDNQLKGVRVVQVVFNTDPEAQEKYENHYNIARRGSSPSYSKYSYLTDQDFAEKDFAVVQTPHGGLTVVQVVHVGEVLALGELPGHKWIIDKVDVEGHKVRQEKEKRKQFLLKSLQDRATQIRNQQKLEEVLEGDEASKELLAELKTLL